MNDDEDGTSGAILAILVFRVQGASMHVCTSCPRLMYNNMNVINTSESNLASLTVRDLRLGQCTMVHHSECAVTNVTSTSVCNLNRDLYELE